MESITKRRRFQAPITNVFDSHSDDDSARTTVTTPLSNASSVFPTLPDSTQSSLLTVGCRVRKSVPEGYKTHTTASGGFTPRPFMTSRLSPATLAAINAPAKYSELTPYAATAANSSQPSSSIHDIGGLPAVQPIATATFCGISLRHMPPASSSSSSSSFSFTSSSTPSSQSPTNKNKRAFDDDTSSDDDIDADFIPQLPPSAFSAYLPSFAHSYLGHQSDNSFMSSHHPNHPNHRRGSSYPFKHTTMPDLNSLSSSSFTTHPVNNPAYRKLAQPKSRLKSQPQYQSPSQRYEPASPEQENFGFFGSYLPSWDTDQVNLGMGGCGYEMMTNLESGAGGMDFADAGFLRRRDEVEMDCS